MNDFLFRGSLQEIDPDVHKLTELEAERQVRKLILIPSESQAPLAVREALSSAFQNIYAEGYPDEETRRMAKLKSWIIEHDWVTSAAIRTRATTKASNTPTWSKHWPAGAVPRLLPPTGSQRMRFSSMSRLCRAHRPTMRFIMPWSIRGTRSWG